MQIVWGSREDALHAWNECLATRDLGGGNSARGPITWFTYQLSRFLREPPIPELLDQGRSEHLEVHPNQFG